MINRTLSQACLLTCLVLTSNFSQAFASSEAQTLPLKEQYDEVLLELEQAQEMLVKQAHSKKLASSTAQDTQKIQERIWEIQLRKTKLERQMASSAAKLPGNFKFGAMLDLYYLYSPGRGQEGSVIPNRVYDRKNNDLTMNLFEINMQARKGNVSVYADLDFGDFADQNAAVAGDPVNHNIGQAYLTYSFSEDFSLSAGKMYTHVGYEVAKTKENWNTSRSFAFTLGGPFWHEGLALRFAPEKGVNTGFFVYDNWDSSDENNSEKTYGAQVGYNAEDFSFMFNAIRGPEGSLVGDFRSVYEFNAQYSLTETVTLAVDALKGIDQEALTPASGSSMVDKEWSSWVGYVHWQADPNWSFTARYELFRDETSNDAAADQYIFSGAQDSGAETVNSLTFTSSYAVDESSEFRFEYRNDQADKDFWMDEDGKLQDKLTTFSLSWLVSL